MKTESEWKIKKGLNYKFHKNKLNSHIKTTKEQEVIMLYRINFLSINFILIFCLGIYLPIYAQDSPWVRKSGLPQEYNLYDVHAFGENAAIVVGDSGIVIKTTDGGDSWVEQETGVTNILRSVYFTDSITGWAVGYSGTIIHTKDGGDSWVEQESGVPNNLRSVYLTDSITGWVVGRDGTILHTTDGGDNWGEQVSGVTKSLNSVYFTDSITGWVVGGIDGTILHTTDGGDSWVEQESGVAGFFSSYLESVYFIDSSTGWAVAGNGTIIHTTDGGNNWVKQESGVDVYLSSIYFTDSITGWVVGSHGTILHTKDGGDNWLVQESDETEYLRSVYFTDSYGWAVGLDGVILNYWASWLYVTVDIQGEGTVTGDGFFASGDEVVLHAMPSEGYEFVNWTDDKGVVSEEPEYTFSMPNEYLTLTANFVEIEHYYFDEGSGTETDPWLIETAGHLNNVRHFLDENHEDKHFKQIADINLDESPWNEGEGWVPIGTANSAFYGNYDGNGKEISNLYIHRDTIEYQGLFGWNNGTISNLGVTDASVTDNGSRAGILAGFNNLGIIENCHTSGTIQSDHEEGRIGGLIAWNESTIKNSHSSASVSTSGILAGGLTGANSGGSLIDCYAGGEVHSASIQVGGLVGTNQAGGQITRCYTTGKTTGENYVGGLVGSNMGENSTINQSYSIGEVAGNSRVGGLAGIQLDSCHISESHSLGAVYAAGNWAGGLVGVCINNTTISGSFSASDVYVEGFSAGGLCGTLQENSIIQNSYATGKISSLKSTGGMAGWADSSQIINSYSTCHVLSEYGMNANKAVWIMGLQRHVLSEYGMNAGGLTGGVSETEIIHSFWNTETSGQITNDGGEGKNTSELISQTTFTEWNFDSIWSIDEEGSYPYLQWQKEPGTHNFPEELPSVIRVPSMFPTIQEGIDRAGHSDTVLVADGVYTGRGNLYLSFKGKDIVLKSENGPEHCVIDYQDGLEEGTTSQFIHGETRKSIMEGFTFINGNVAIFIENASPTIRNNIIIYNALGIHCGRDSNPLILNNNISNNSGTGIVCDNSSAEIKRNLISENGGDRFSSVISTTFDRYQRPDETYITCSTEYGGMALYNMSSPNIQNNLITQNKGMQSGGIYSDSTSSAFIANNHILGNASINGGSVFMEHASSKIVNNLIAYSGSSDSSEGLSRWYKDPLFMAFLYDGAKLNSVFYYFGFVNYGDPCEVILSGCAGLEGSVWAETGERYWVIVRSKVDEFGHGGGLTANIRSAAGNFSIIYRREQYAGVYDRVSSTNITSFGISEGRAGSGITMADHIDLPLIANNNMFGNSGPNYAYRSSGDEEGTEFNLTGSNGNISQDPQLDSVTFELCAKSPCIDAGTTNIDSLDFGLTDYSGHARITDGNGDGNAVIDIGAFEFQRISNTYLIIAQAAENGSISPTDEVEVEYGGVQAFDIVPDEGFRVAYIRIDGNEIVLETDENWDAESGQYTFSNVTEAHTIEVGFEDATAVKDVADQNELKVYPNPAKNELWIEFNYRGSDRPVIILQNLKGQTLKQIPVNETGALRKRMTTHNLSSGVYLLTIQGEEVFPVKKVMIEN